LPDAIGRGRFAARDKVDSAAPLRRRGTRIAVFCSSLGNFYMREIADMLAWGLQAEGIDTAQRDEMASPEEPFDLRIFVAPHEFFWLGEGREWTEVADAAGSVLYNVEQPQTPWFCRAFPLLLKAPLVLDINLQSAAILRRAGCKVVHFMPGHLPTARYAQPPTSRAFRWQGAMPSPGNPMTGSSRTGSTNGQSTCCSLARGRRGETMR
jgi:hypothetical protein